jgi:hypothetical protein
MGCGGGLGLINGVEEGYKDVGRWLLADIVAAFIFWKKQGHFLIAS